MAEVVLRQGVRVAMDQARHGRPGDAEDAFDLSAYDFGNLIFSLAAQCRIGGPAAEAGRIRRSRPLLSRAAARAQAHAALAAR